MTNYGDRKKCYKCYRPQSSCMCEHINSFDTNTKFVILMHPKEFKKVKNNTGYLTKESLKNSELFVGIDFSEHRRINEIIATHESYILFPSENALNLSSTYPKKMEGSKKKLAIFLIDSTWACTKKMFNESSNLNKLEHMSFETSRVSEYQIKEQPKSHFLSTIESTHVVLELLDGHKIENLTKDNLGGFLNPFYKMIEYQKDLIDNSKTHAVRFKRKTTGKKI